MNYRTGSQENPPPQITVAYPILVHMQFLYIFFYYARYLRDNTSGAQAIHLVVNRPALFVSPSSIFAIKDFFMLVFPPEPTPQQKAEAEKKKREENRKSLTPRTTPRGDEEKRLSTSLTPRGDDKSEKRKSGTPVTPRGDEKPEDAKEKRRSVSHRKSNPPPLQLPLDKINPPSQSPRAAPTPVCFYNYSIRVINLGLVSRRPSHYCNYCSKQP